MVLAGVFLTGCTTVKSKRLGYSGNVPDFATTNVTQFRQDQDYLVSEFARLGGLPGPPVNGMDWRPVVDGGMLYVDTRCERFMDALFWLNRVRETTSNQIQYAGAAASAILALTNAAKDLIGIAPLGIGLADQTVNNVSQGLLYHLDPGDVAQLVARKQGTYRDLIKDVKYTSRPAAMNAVAQYAANCLPVRIEGDVNQAIATSKFERVDHRKKNEQPPTVPDGEQPAPPPVAPGTPAAPAEPPAVGDNEAPVLEVTPSE
jgi:hypothetical protein